MRLNLEERSLLYHETARERHDHPLRIR